MCVFYLLEMKVVKVSTQASSRASTMAQRACSEETWMGDSASSSLSVLINKFCKRI